MSVSSLAEALSQLSVQQQQQQSLSGQASMGNMAPNGLFAHSEADSAAAAAQSQMLLAGLQQFSQQQQQQQGEDGNAASLIPGLSLYGDPSAGGGNTSETSGGHMGDFGLSSGASGQGQSPAGPQGSLAQSSSGLLNGPGQSSNGNGASGSNDVHSSGAPGSSAGGNNTDVGGQAPMPSHPGHPYMGGPGMGQPLPGPPGMAGPGMQQLPNFITVTAATDPMQAAGLINFTFSQSPHSFFLLNCQAGPGAATSLPVLNAALKVVLSARKISQQALARFDLGFVPFLVSDAADMLGVLIYKCNMNPDLAKARGQVLKMEASSNPLVAGLSLFNMLQSSPQQLEVIFTADAAKVALQALAIMRINLANNGRDVLLLASTIEYAADAAGPKSYYLMKLTPTTPPLPCFQHQIDMPKPPMGAFAGEPAMLGRFGGPPGRGYDQGPGGMGGGRMPGGMKGAGGPFGGPGGAPGMMGGPGAMMGSAAAAAASMLQKPRARKADYVIVTEDTAIKNAAGAIAKVLGRVSNQGQCCPVYTEKKTESFTTVISVAVKAIAVARGYVCNEGMGHEVGFQPYLRNLDKRMDLMELHQYMLDKKMMHGGMGGGMHGMMGGPHKGGMMGGPGPMGAMGGDFNLDEESLHDERCELAFDVFKVPQMADLQEAGNLPVKVTAHSRPNVVSNIISKLVSERDGAVLITAGGKAMHVAMTAVVSARARLKSKGIDVLLLPKFVTVDTTSTLGWESVFLRFVIVRWMPALTAGDQGMGAGMAAGMAMGMGMGGPQDPSAMGLAPGGPRGFMLTPAV